MHFELEGIHVGTVGLTDVHLPQITCPSPCLVAVGRPAAHGAVQHCDPRSATAPGEITGVSGTLAEPKYTQKNTRNAFLPQNSYLENG